MADFWTDPKINWIDNDGIGYGDLNRIEQNTKALRDATFRKVQGFGYSVDNSVVGQDGVITITPGSCYSENGVPIRMSAPFVKNLTTWAPGNGATYGGMAAAVTVAGGTWYYIFVIMKPSDGSTEIMIDDNPDGNNVVSGIYTEKRFIHAVRTQAAGGDGSFDLSEMYAVGDNVFINPSAMFTTRGIQYNMVNDTYALLELKGPFLSGFALPNRDVLAKLNIFTEVGVYAIGIISAYGSYFTVPINFLNSSVRVGEYVFGIPRLSSGSFVDGMTADCDVMVPANRKVNAAVLFDSGSPDIFIAVRGYVDDRAL